MTPTILFVDDDETFKALIACALKRSRLEASVQYLCDGEEAISYLSRQGPFEDEMAYPRPALVLLDLKMPRVNGFEVLEWRSSRPELNETPFVVLSSSNLDRDQDRASELGADGYLVKPMNLSQLIEMLEGLAKFWSDSCKAEEKA